MQIIKRLSSKNARLLLKGARRRAEELNLTASLAVTDESGNLLAFERMDGSAVAGIAMSQDKAYTAAATHRPTHSFSASNTPGSLAFGLHTELGGRFSSIAGGLPITQNGECIGAIGISSGSPQKDIEIAEAGVSAFLKSLEE